LVRQLAHQPGKVHLRVTGLEAALHRRLHSALGLGVTPGLEEIVGIVAEVLDGRERNRIDPVLDRPLSGRREFRDPQSERPASERVIR
jgi:hypothetical protein